MIKLLFTILFCVALASATTFYKEEFDDGWEKRWVQSTADNSNGNAGKFVGTPGKYYGNAKTDSGVQTSQDARFYKYSSKFPTFNNKGKPLVIQYSVKHEQDLDCGGDYIKVGPPDVDQEAYTGDSPYNIMFGPDKCGSTNRVHFIFAYKGTNHLWKKTLTPPSDKLTHLYTAIINPDQTYEVRIDNVKKESGTLVEDWDFLPPQEIDDPASSKPKEWVDEKEIPDPEAHKPSGWDDTPKEIVDPDAKKPDDWDDELDGTWEAPQIPNPEYKGEWAPAMIPNPEYKGEWIHPRIPNPEYKTDDHISVYDSGYVSFEIWQVKSGSVYDHILVSDSVEDAEEFVSSHFTAQQTAEKEMFDEQEKEREEAERVEREETAAKMAEEGAGEESEEGASEGDDDDDEHDDHDHDHDHHHDEL